MPVKLLVQYASTNAALKLSAHLFQRPGEIRSMKWADLDLDEGVWTIPACEMKMRREHRVPLSRKAIAIIRSTEEVSTYSEWVFPSWTPKKPLSENAVNGALKRLGYAGKMTAHDVAVALVARDRTQCGPVAPPDGLYLVRVDYGVKT